MYKDRVEILVGNTPETAVVYQIAEKQRKVLSNYYSSVFIGPDVRATISVVHKVGVDTSSSAGIKIFFLHFDPYDIRIRSSITNFDEYISAFDVVVCINSKQQFYCSKRNIKNTLLSHGSDFDNTKIRIQTDSRKPIMAMACDYYRGNVKGERYFFDLAKKMSTFLEFKIIGKGWNLSDVMDGVEVINVDSYSELKEYFSTIDILFIGSRYEAGPASFPDAVNSNKYVVATPVGMVLDNFIESMSGYYLTFDWKKDFSNINKILIRIENNTLARYRYSYPSWDEQIRGIIEVVNEIRNQKG